MSHTFSRLSRGYGTWDGIAKIERCESPERSSDYFSLDELYLPPIEKKYRKPEDSKDYVSSYQNKVFELPKVETTISYHATHVPKTYTTRKGALLLYAEDYFIPGSSKPRKRKRKPKRQSAVTFNTLGDLRDNILSYKKNGGDPLFLYLLQKTYSSYRERRAIRPGFSPKRYIANLGRSLHEESWNKLASSGSLKDSTLKCYDRHAGFLPLPDKPQPYSTMSLPPISPSNSMLDSSFNFYQNGMSTGAASLISVNSEDQPEYAPSSRALSPAESLSERLSEVNTFPLRKDNRYASLNSRQKANLLSQMLVHSTLQGDSVSDMQGWETDFSQDVLGMEKEPVLPGVISKGRTRNGSLRSANNFPSVPRLPPIQSAGAPTTSASTASASNSTATSTNGDVHFENSERGRGKETEDLDALDPSGVELFVGNDEVGAKGDVVAEILADGIDTQVDESESNTYFIHKGSTTGNVLLGVNDLTSRRSLGKLEDGDLTDNSISVEDSHNEVEKDMNGIEGNEKLPLELKSSGICDSSIAADTVEGHKVNIESKQELAQKQIGSGNADVMTHEGSIGKHDVFADGNGNVSTCDGETELHGMPVGGSDKDAELEAKGAGEADSASDVTEGNRPALPTHISLEELHGHARVVASKVLSRPKSGVSFMADARAAVAMWADRLSSILGPLPKDARVSSAGHSPGQDPRPTDDTSSTHLKSTARQRKVSRSAGPPLAALRQALKISGGDFKQELLKDFDDLSDKINRMPRGKVGIPSRVKTGHTYYEPLKDGEVGSMRSSGSPGPTQSIQSERVSLSDLQMDIFSLVTGQQETTFDYHNAEFVSDSESEEEDNFRAAVMSVLSAHSDKRFSVVVEKPKPKAAIARKTSSGKSENGKTKTDKMKTKNGTPPFQVPRPKDEKPPPGLQNKVPKMKTKGSKQEKKLVSKPVKKTTKKAQKGKTVKSVIKEKENQKENQDDIETVVESVNTQEMESVVADSPGSTVRVDSETGEREPEVLSVTSPVSPLSSGISASRSSKATTGEAASPTMTVASSVGEFPKLVPRPVEPADEVETEEPVVDSGVMEELRLKEFEAQKAKEARAHKRVAERAAAAERRRLEVERKRKEREDAKKKAVEEEARLEKLRTDAEEDMKRRETERRRRRDEKDDEKRRKDEDEKEQERLARVKAEREKRQRDEWKRKQQLIIAQRKLEEELRREQEKIEAEIEAAARHEQEERLKSMEESERRAFEERMRQEEEELRRRLELQKLKEEEERRVREEQKRKHQEERALLRQKQLQRQLFMAGLFKEQHFLSFSQRLTRAFTFSYFNILPWSYLKHFKSLSPVGAGNGNKRIPPTIVEEDEKEPMGTHVD